MVKRATSLVVMTILVLLTGGILVPVKMVDGSSDTHPLPPFNPRIDNQVQGIMTETYIPSVTVAVVRNDSIIWAKGFGEQTELDTIYMIGSVTKTFTSTAIFQLYEQGSLELDDDVNDYLPFSLKHPNFTETPITIRMLLLHTSGLNKETDQYIHGMAQDIMERIGMENPYDWLPYPHWMGEHLTPNGTLYDPAVWSPSQPGTNRRYSNIGYNVLAYILHLVSGLPPWEYMQENIFTPLGMQDTGYNLSEFDLSQLAPPYQYNESLDENIEYPHYNFFSFGAGSIRSNIYDLARFLLVHMHNGVSNGTRILEEQTIELMHGIQAAWFIGGAGMVNWLGWGGTEGDMYGFHTKAYAIHDSNTTVPYAVITFLNQDLDEGRSACFAITCLLQKYVHQYDTMEYVPPPDFTTVALVVTGAGISVVILFCAVRRVRQGATG